MKNLKNLFEPYPLNDKLTLKNKIIMAPMTRAFADDDLVPTDDMVNYYSRRAEAGLIITEGTIIRPDSIGYKKVPGIYNEAQISAWKKVTEAVHQHDGKIFSQIWHVGRVSHPSFIEGALPISSSETTMSSKMFRANHLFYGKSRAANELEIKELIQDYATAAKNAMAAGFDGVEIHGANGYLIDQFLHNHTNLRTDQYGGFPENMARFALAVVRACGEAIGFEKIGIRLSPGAYLNEIIGDSRDHDVFQYLLEQLNALPIAYVHTGNFDDKVKFKELKNRTMTHFIRQHYQGTVVASGSYSFEQADEGVKEGAFDLVAIGRPFIANPDLISRLKSGHTIKEYDNDMLGTLY